MRGTRKQIAFDMDTMSNDANRTKSAIAKYFNNNSVAYYHIKRFMKENGFINEQRSVYTSAEPMYERHVDAVLKSIAKTLPWISECLTDINITEVGKVYDLMDEITDYCDSYWKEKEICKTDMNRYSFKRVQELKADFDNIKSTSSDMRKQFAFDLDMEPGSKYFDYFADTNKTAAFRKIRSFMNEYGFERVQDSIYVSDRPLNQKHIDMLLKNMCREMPWLADCSKGFVVTDIGSTYNITDELKSYCSHYGADRKKWAERRVELNRTRGQKMVSTANLHQALNAYMEGDGNYYTRGDWSIAKGGNDLTFEVYYKDTPVANYVRDRHDSTDKGELSVWGNFTQEEKNKIANCICKTCDIDISAIKRDNLEEDLENDNLDDRMKEDDYEMDL